MSIIIRGSDVGLTVGELIKKLQDIDPETRVLTEMYSSMTDMSKQPFEAKVVIPNKGGWYETYYADQWKNTEQPNRFVAVVFEGN